MAGNARGLGSDNMSDEDKARIHQLGGQMSGGNFKNDPARASLEGKKGAAAQSIKDKAKGGRSSRRSET
jgi:general stress protein YciG